MITWVMFLGVFLALHICKTKGNIFTSLIPSHFTWDEKVSQVHLEELTWYFGTFFIIIPEDDLWLLSYPGCFGKLIEKVLYLTASTVLLLSNNIMAGLKENITRLYTHHNIPIKKEGNGQKNLKYLIWKDKNEMQLPQK